MGRRRGRPSRPGSQAGLFERVLFTFMGPPQLGDASAAPTAPRDTAADLCPRCAHPWDEHERVRTPSRGYVQCPAPPGPPD